MLSREQAYLLTLVRAALKGESAPADERCSMEEMCRLVLKSGVSMTVFKQLPPTMQSALRAQTMSNVRQAMVQQADGEQVIKKLAGAGFAVLPLKGWEMRALYPEALMRQMSDLDFLVKPYDYRRIRALMEEMGYSAEKESSWKHDKFFKASTTVEMHKRLTDDSAAIRDWEARMDERKVCLEGNVYRMTNEDFYLFHFVHLHKDFMNGMLGFKRILDTWLLQKTEKDDALVRRELESMGLSLFHERMVTLSYAAMGEKEMDDNSLLLLEHALRHGVYGSGISYKAGRAARLADGSLQKGRLRSVIAAVFLPFDRMKAHYPVLEKRPILLPWCWLKRIKSHLNGNLRQKWQRMELKGLRQEDVDEMRRFFEAGGVRTGQG